MSQIAMNPHFVGNSDYRNCLLAQKSDAHPAERCWLSGRVERVILAVHACEQVQ